jgi:hypothetical protein
LRPAFAEVDGADAVQFGGDGGCHGLRDGNEGDIRAQPPGSSAGGLQALFHGLQLIGKEAHGGPRDREGRSGRSPGCYSCRATREEDRRYPDIPFQYRKSRSAISFIA